MEFKTMVFKGVYSVIGMHLPKGKNSADGLFTRIRTALVRGYVDYCGFRVNIQRKATIAKRVTIGDYSGVGERSLIQGNVVIGSHVMMGPDVYIYTQNHNFSRTDITMDKQGFLPEEQVTIENDVWIGAKVTILPGVKIGTGSVIGACAVVTKNVEPYSVVAGNPAIVVKNRNSKD